MPDTGYCAYVPWDALAEFCARSESIFSELVRYLIEFAEIYAIQVLDIFTAVILGRANGTPLGIAHALATRYHIVPVVVPLDMYSGHAEQFQ